MNEQLEEVSPALVIVSVCLSETFNEVQFLNESVTVENVSVSNSHEELYMKKINF